jgi:hypothetical protein
MARFPGDRVVGARGIATDTDGADAIALGVIDRQAAAKYVNAANQSPDHRVLSASAVIGDGPFIGNRHVNRVAGLQTEQAATGLDRRVEVGGRECDCGPGRTRGQAEGVGRVGLLRRDHAAAEPDGFERAGAAPAALHYQAHHTA